MDDLSYETIGKAMEVHRQLGPGLDELFYHELLATKLRLAGIHHDYKPPGKLVHEGNQQTQLDCIVINGRCAIKVTALQDLQRAADRAILQTYLRLLNLPWGLVVNFGRRQIETLFATRPRSP